MRGTLTGNEFSSSHRVLLGNPVLFIAPVGMIEAVVYGRKGAHDGQAAMNGLQRRMFKSKAGSITT